MSKPQSWPPEVKFEDPTPGTTHFAFAGYAGGDDRSPDVFSPANEEIASFEIGDHIIATFKGHWDHEFSRHQENPPDEIWVHVEVSTPAPKQTRLERARLAASQPGEPLLESPTDDERARQPEVEIGPISDLDKLVAENHRATRQREAAELACAKLASGLGGGLCAQLSSMAGKESPAAMISSYMSAVDDRCVQLTFELPTELVTALGDKLRGGTREKNGERAEFFKAALQGTLENSKALETLHAEVERLNAAPEAKRNAATGRG